jgi:hypothetical protein
MYPVGLGAKRVLTPPAGIFASISSNHVLFKAVYLSYVIKTSGALGYTRAARQFASV